MAEVTIEPGQLNLQLTIEEDVGADAGNLQGHVHDWQPWADFPNPLWAGMRQLSGREQERAAMLEVTATHMITMRYFPGLTAVKMRAKMERGETTRIFNIGVVNNVNEANVKLEILACERIA